MSVDHVLLADGYHKNWVEDFDNVLHLVLQKNSGEYGTTLRSLGFILAMRRDYDVIRSLDGDNLPFPEHFKNVIAGFNATVAGIIFCKATYVANW